LAEAVKMHLEEKVRKREAEAYSVEREREKYDLFRVIVDPDNTMPISALRAEHLRKYLSVLYGLPSNRSKAPRYRDIPLPKLIKMAEAGEIPQADRMATTTIRNHCQRISGLILWAGKNEFHSNADIRSLLTVKKDKQAHEHRDPFTLDDIKRLFEAAPYRRAGMKQKAKGEDTAKPDRFWLPLLALFTGARIEELAQLHTDDIVLYDPAKDQFQPLIDKEGRATAAAGGVIPCLYINEGKPYQRLKNKPSQRYVPLAPILANDLGFLNYVIHYAHGKREALNIMKAHQGRLFPKLLKAVKSRMFSHQTSNWFRRYRTVAGVVASENEPSKDFHSFRHTIGQWGDRHQVPEKLAARYLGHSHGTMTYGRYSSDTTPAILYEHITKPLTEYLRECLDLEGLKQSAWANMP
jgi:integrase